ncbi:major outer membrane protein [Calothrix sp. NIES-4071]|nr:major outer membrane protein [Calothrix sp. NIES-4071]BAZ61905.1 major outer membrane protein [Calothrix sp. NIES-4105]
MLHNYTYIYLIISSILLNLSTVINPAFATVERSVINNAQWHLELSNKDFTDTSLNTTPAIISQKTSSFEEQVTSVNQLEDIQPTDWAFRALQSLIERNGVIAGYSDGTFRGNKAMTRYEFASALNTTLERVNGLIAQGTTSISRDDLTALQRLQEEFKSELTLIRGRVDSLEARAASLEANQFSTTTKLSGQVIFALTGGGFSGTRIIDVTGREIARENPNTTFIYRAALDLDTSFSGTDLLKIRLDIGSNGADDNAAGYLEPGFGSTLDFSAKPPLEKFGLSRLYYTFSPSKDITVSLGSRISLTDYVDLNSYANLSFLDFSTQALVNNYILFPVQGLGAGAAVSWKPGQGSFTARAAYIAASANQPEEASSSFVPGIFPLGYTLYPNSRSNQGLFGDPYQGVIELEYAPSKHAALRLQYASGNVLDGEFNVFGANVELAISPSFAVFGRYGFGSYNDTAFGDIEPSYWMAGFAFPDLFKEGGLAGIAIGQPFIENAVGNATQTNFEAFYNLPVSDNIRITPLVQVITNPANQEENGTIFTGTLRTVFSF